MVSVYQFGEGIQEGSQTNLIKALCTELEDQCKHPQKSSALEDLGTSTQTALQRFLMHCQ